MRVVSELAECELLWKQFSTNERLWDVWEIIHSLHDVIRYKLHFMVLEKNGAARGLIPLVEDTKDGSYELFGGCYPDNRSLWVTPEDFLDFFNALPEKTELFDINGDCVKKILAAHPSLENYFSEKDERYFLLPEEFNRDFTQHIATKFSGDKRKHLLGELRKIREREPIMTTQISPSDVNTFITLCNKNFGEESDLKTEGGQAEARRLVTCLEQLGYLRGLLVTIDEKQEAVALCGLYNDVLTVIYSSSNNDIKNLGKFLNFETIQEACKLGVKEIDYMMGTVWKPAWHMNHETCYTFKKSTTLP